MTQEKLAEKIATSSHYIGQIELKNKFPSPEMLERIAEALEIESPQLFSMTSFTDEALKRFQSGIQTDLEAALGTALKEALSKSVETRTSELKP